MRRIVQNGERSGKPMADTEPCSGPAPADRYPAGLPCEHRATDSRCPAGMELRWRRLRAAQSRGSCRFWWTRPACGCGRRSCRPGSRSPAPRQSGSRRPGTHGSDPRRPGHGTPDRRRARAQPCTAAEVSTMAALPAAASGPLALPASRCTARTDQTLNGRRCCPSR